jgi:mannose-6-phosphate isomerase
VRPIPLPANQVHHFYRGGEAIAGFRGISSTDDHAPEDWIGSTTTLFGDRTRGVTVLPDGRTLRDAIAAAPADFLGPEHVERFGADSALLVKLLDAGERLPVHFHPDGRFAAEHLGLAHGKTEAWIILETRGSGPVVHVGFREALDRSTVAGWVDRQEGSRLLAALHEVPVEPGDWIYVPAGVAHAVGEGVLLLELQEPTDLSVLLEWGGFAIDGARDGHLGLGFDVALDALDCSALDAEALAALLRPRAGDGEVRPGVRRLLPAGADVYFRAELLAPECTLEPAFSILVVVEGSGALETERGGALDLRRGETVLVPFAAGAAELRGEVEAIRCLPPLVREGWSG